MLYPCLKSTFSVGLASSVVGEEKKPAPSGWEGGLESWRVTFCQFIFLLVGSILASMPNFSFLEGVILTIPCGVVWVGWSDYLVEVELWLSMAKKNQS